MTALSVSTVFYTSSTLHFTHFQYTPTRTVQRIETSDKDLWGNMYNKITASLGSRSCGRKNLHRYLHSTALSKLTIWGRVVDSQSQIKILHRTLATKFVSKQALFVSPLINVSHFWQGKSTTVDKSISLTHSVLAPLLRLPRKAPKDGSFKVEWF